MTRITADGIPVQIIGELPKINSLAPPFKLTKTDLTDCCLGDFNGHNVILNIFLSLDTSTCAASVRRFNAEVSKLDNTVVLCISADLPFAHKRFCEIEGLNKIIPLSVFRSPEFGKDYGITITNSPIRGLLARSIVIVNPSGKVTYTELVPEITQEPEYEQSIAVLKKNQN